MNTQEILITRCVHVRTCGDNVIKKNDIMLYSINRNEMLYEVSVYFLK